MSEPRKTILDYVATFLEVDTFDDYCVNGLQVEGKAHISHLISGVSANKVLFEKAKEAAADMIIVHHGLFWKNDPSPFAVTGFLRERLRILMTADINLCAYHLPLDAHQTIGNNHLLCQIFGISERTPFEVGFLGHFNKDISFQKIVDIVVQEIHPDPAIFHFGPASVSHMVIISGSPNSADLVRAAQAGADTFLCGGIGESTVYIAQELHMNYINAGHYNTEKLGIKALGDFISQKFNITHQFIDVPNPI